MSVQVQASFKKDQKHLDGLDHHRKDLIDAPLQPRVVVAIIDVTSITHDVLDGSDTPKIRLRQVEVLDGPEAMKAVDMLNRQYQRRTGREDSQASLFDEFDPTNPTVIEANRADAVADAPALDEDPRTAEEIMAERAEAKAAEAGVDGEDQGDADEDTDEGGGVPWIPDAPASASADFEAPGVEFSGGDPDVPAPVTPTEDGRASTRRRGKK